MWQTSNPALNNNSVFDEYYGKKMYAEQAKVTTVQGVVNKTALLITIAVAAGAGGYWLISTGTSMSFVWISCLASMGICFGAYMVLRGNPAHARWLAPIFAVAEGTFLGALTAMLDRMLEGMAIAATGGLALQALIITISIMGSMLALYSMRILRPTRKFVATVSVLSMGIAITYLISWPLAMFGMQLPFVSLSSAFGEGWMPMIGLGINVLFLGVASMWLIIDFGLIEEKVKAGAPKQMEWYCGFVLLVSLAMIYYESVKLAFRVAALLGSRD